MQMPRTWPMLLSALFAAIIGVLLALGAFSPQTFYTLMREDFWAEWCTFLAFLTAAILAFDGLMRRSSSNLERLVFAGLGLFCLFVAGEEISWGQRLFGFTPPEVFLRENYQQEFEIHNVLRVLSDSDIARSRWQVVTLAGLYGILSVGVQLRWLPVVFAPHVLLLPWLASCAAINALYPFHRTGEMAEMLLGLVFAADLAMRRHGGERLNGARTATAAILVVMAAGAITPVALEHLVYGADPRRAATAREEVELLANDLRRPRTLQVKAFSTERFHKRLFTGVKQGYIRFGETSAFLDQELSPAEAAEGQGRRDRHGYFIDPWGQAYWIVHEYRPGETWCAVIYSLGPNRKRDLQTKDLQNQFESSGPVVVGDDLGVFINFARDFPGGARLPSP